MYGLLHALGWRVLPGIAMSLVCMVMAQVGAFRSLEYAVYNNLYTLRGERPWDSRLVLITIDDASIQRLGRFPWPRRRYAELLQILSQEQPSVVGMNLVFSEPSEDDGLLAIAMADYGRVVLAQASNNAGYLFPPVPQLQEAAIATGHILHREDADGVTRSLPLELGKEPILGLAVVQAYSLVKENVPLPSTRGQFWLNWPGRSRSLPQYSFVDVLQNRVSPVVFRDKIVLVGPTATGIDALVTPYERTPPASGIHLQATLINNLLQRTSLAPLSCRWLGLLLLLGGPGLALIFSFSTGTVRLLTWFGVCVLWVGAGIALFSAGHWLPIVLPMGLFTSTAVATTFVEQVQLHIRLRRQVQALWHLHQRDLVVRQVDPYPLLKPASALVFDTGESVAQLAELAEQFGRSQSTQAAIARSLSIGLLAADMDGRVWFCNPVIAAWLGIQVGDYLTERLISDWLSDEQWHLAVQSLTLEHRPFSHVLQRDDRWFELKLEPLRYTAAIAKPGDSMPQPDGLLVVLEDVTVQKQAEVTLENQVDELKRLGQLKDDFLSTVSHELRSPMTNIQMAIKLLEISKSPESTAHYLKILKTECTREIDLINDLLDLQRLEADAQLFHAEEINLQHWLPPIIEPFYERAESQQQTIEIEMDPQLPIVASDSASLQRVLVELVNNACKYTPPTGVIRVIVHSNASHIQLIVSNSGTEIPEAELPRIFEKFYRVPRADPWKRGGTGLGLALVKKLVQCLGGTIEVKSGAGQTTFTIALPFSLHTPNPLQD